MRLEGTQEVMQRPQVLGSGRQAEAGGYAPAGAAGEAALVPDKEVHDAELGLAMAVMMGAYKLEGTTSYDGVITESAVRPHQLMRESREHNMKAMAAAADATQSLLRMLFVMHNYVAHQHALPEFSPEAFRKDGPPMREAIEFACPRLRHAAQVLTALALSLCALQVRLRDDAPRVQATGARADIFLFGMVPFGLLLWWGDLRGMRAGVVKVLDGHQRAESGAPGRGDGWSTLGRPYFRISLCLCCSCCTTWTRCASSWRTASLAQSDGVACEGARASKRWSGALRGVLPLHVRHSLARRACSDGVCGEHWHRCEPCHAARVAAVTRRPLRIAEYERRWAACSHGAAGPACCARGCTASGWATG